MNQNNNLTVKQDNETLNQFIYRLCSNKDQLGLSWSKISLIVREQTGFNRSETYYRRGFANYMFSEVTEEEIVEPEVDVIDEQDDDNISVVDEISEKIREFHTERVRLTDERTQNNAYIRRMSREQTIKDIAHEYAVEMSRSGKSFLSKSTAKLTPPEDLLREGILLLSDWHYGMVCENYWNRFDPDICRQRLDTLLENVINIIEKDCITSITVLNLSDLIAGRIHAQIRIESRFDVITQTMDVAEILAEFLDTLSDYCSIEYYDCLDNHSRLEPNKAESLDLETLVRIIPWYLKERLIKNNQVTIHDNAFGPDIITCNVLGHDIIGVHGDYDKPATALDKLTLMTHKHYDMLCTAHLHHFNMDEKNQTLIVSNGSLMGVDSYAEKLRLTSDPSQTFITVSKKNVAEAIYRIVLK